MLVQPSELNIPPTLHKLIRLILTNDRRDTHKETGRMAGTENYAALKKCDRREHLMLEQDRKVRITILNFQGIRRE